MVGDVEREIIESTANPSQAFEDLVFYTKMTKLPTLKRVTFLKREAFLTRLGQSLSEPVLRDSNIAVNNSGLTRLNTGLAQSGFRRAISATIESGSTAGEWKTVFLRWSDC